MSARDLECPSGERTFLAWHLSNPRGYIGWPKEAVLFHLPKGERRCNCCTYILQDVLLYLLQSANCWKIPLDG